MKITTLIAGTGLLVASLTAHAIPAAKDLMPPKDVPVFTAQAGGQVGSASYEDGFGLSFSGPLVDDPGVAGALAASAVDTLSITLEFPGDENPDAGGSFTLVVDGSDLFSGLFENGLDIDIGTDGVVRIVAQSGTPANGVAAAAALEPVGIIIDYSQVKDTQGNTVFPNNPAPFLSDGNNRVTAQIFSLTAPPTPTVPEASTLVIMLGGGLAMLVGGLRRRAR